MALTKNKKVLDFVNDSAELAQPDKIVWIDGSETQIKKLKEEAVKSGDREAQPGEAARLLPAPHQGQRRCAR